jgi:hypothetical protein
VQQFQQYIFTHKGAFMTYSFRSTAFLLSTTLATSLILSGCNMKRPDRVDGKLVLNGLPSPDVKGIDDSLLQKKKVTTVMPASSIAN